MTPVSQLVFLEKDSSYEKTFRLAWFTPPFKVSFYQSVFDKQETSFRSEVALRIFPEIKVKSDILCVISKPITLISFGGAVLVGGVLLALSGIVALVAAGILISAAGAIILTYSIYNHWNGRLSELSEAYAKQSQEAEVNIALAEKTSTIVFFLAKDKDQDYFARPEAQWRNPFLF